MHARDRFTNGRNRLSSAGASWRCGDVWAGRRDIESMKMEISVQADADGRVKTVTVSEGVFVDEGNILLELE